MGRKTWVFRTNISLVVFLSFLVCLCSSTDTITFNQPLKDGDLLISNDSSYALGFFTPGNSIGKRYVGLWYLNIPEKVVVWVANRDNPVNGTSGILFIDSTGNLVIQDNKTGTSVWNTSLSFEPTGTRDYSAQLQDTGNLVLYHDRVDKWQSFDYPTNTLLASMKVGVGKNKSIKWFLRSWKSPDDPGTGEYTFGIDLTGKPQAFLYKNSSRVWRVGPWNGIRWSGVPQMTPEITPYAFTENDEEFSEEYWIRDPSSVYTIVMLNDSGTVNKIIWKGSGNGKKKWDGVWWYPNDDCDYYGHCGAFGICDSAGFSCRCVSGFMPKSNQDWRQGCWRSAIDKCRNGEGFLKLENMKMPDTEMTAVNTTIGLEECRVLCLSNCSCTAYASANISDSGTGCITWYGDLIDMREFTHGGQDVYVRVSASDLGQLGKKSKDHHGRSLVVSVILPIVAAIFVLYCSITTNIRKGKTPRPSSNTSLQLVKYMEEVGHAYVLAAFDLNTIRVATNNFSAENKIGEGGFGSVYKGMLQNGQFVAIKTLSRTSQQGMEEFKNEVKLIARLQHRNLVRLLGCCIQQGEKMLVYEYLPNKALDSFIFDNRPGVLLEWKKRFEIILGIAQGLLYLHQDSRLRIVHRDLKASNVLLDDSMNPKISDFGMAKLFEEEQVEANTNRVVGTYGYMSPEYAMGGNFSIKSDVYSFGVLLLEIVSGKKNKHKYKETSLNLIGDVWDFWNEERALEIIDPSLGESCDGQEVLRCIHVGLLCVQLHSNDRPTMSEVIFMLSNDTELSRPNQPGFALNQGNNAAPLSDSTSDGGNQSSNTMSITELVGR